MERAGGVNLQVRVLTGGGLPGGAGLGRGTRANGVGAGLRAQGLTGAASACFWGGTPNP